MDPFLRDFLHEYNVFRLDNWDYLVDNRFL